MRLGLLLLSVAALLGLVGRTAGRGYVNNWEVYVHLFEWPHDDVANECEQWLGPMGFTGVQISPPQEHIVLPDNNPPFPWWQRYQPVSYNFVSRSGNHSAFAQMVSRCAAAGVEVYVDAVFQHTTGAAVGYGSGGSYYNGNTFDYPAVPYTAADFHGCTGCDGSCNIDDYTDRLVVQNCRLVGLRDLDTADPSVQTTLANYLTAATDLGVAGFRMDAVKHVSTDDLSGILSRLPSSPFVYQEVIGADGEPIQPAEYLPFGRVTEFQYCYDIARMLRNNELQYMQHFGESWGFLPDDDAVCFTDNHDNQRGHGGGGNVLTHKEPALYRLANVYMLAWPYGFPQVMSSYFFTNTEAGPPSDGSGATEGPRNCTDGRWVCEHRWPAIANMVRFRSVAEDEPVVHWWTDNTSHIAFARGRRAFLAISTYYNVAGRSYLTGLPAGSYCNVVLSTNPSSCERITVDSAGYAFFSLSNRETPAVAIHIDAM